VSSFLSKLDKRSARRRGGTPQGQDIILRKEESSARPSKREQKRSQTTILLTSREPSPEGLLAELLGFQKKAASSDRLRGKSGDSDTPPWQTQTGARTAQLNALVPVARRLLQELMQPGISDRELEVVVKRAVSIAAQELAAEMLITSRDTHEATLELIALVAGKGPLKPLFDDPFVTDVYVDDWNRVRCKRLGKSMDTPCVFRAPSDYDAFCSSLIEQSKERLTATKPRIDVVLADEWRSRVNIVHGSLRGEPRPGIAVRIPRLQSATMYDLLRSQTLPAAVAAWLSEFMAFGDVSALVIGPSGSGKTTAATALLNAVGSDERVLLLEHLPEIYPASCHIERLTLAHPRVEVGGVGLADVLDVVRARAPHRIVFGEVRERDRFAFLELLADGYSGSIATMCSEDAREALSRLAQGPDGNGNNQHSAQMVSRLMRLVLRLQNHDGRPCLGELCEVLPAELGEIRVVPLVRYEGEARGKRVWRKLVHKSALFDLMAERGVEMMTGPTLLPPLEKPENVSEEERL
jgi:pilus assembly protein CpaF